MKIFVTWQLIVTLDSIRNSCDVLKHHFPIVWMMLMWMLILGTSTTGCQKFQRVQVPTRTAAKLAPGWDCKSLTHSCAVAKWWNAVLTPPSSALGHFGTLERLSRGGWPDSIHCWIIVLIPLWTRKCTIHGQTQKPNCSVTKSSRPSERAWKWPVY